MKNLSNYTDTKFDETFSKLENLIWKPFIGKLYNKTTPKILIVGESHYVPTGENFEDYLDPNWTRLFIAKEGLQETPWYSGTHKNNLVREVEKTLIRSENYSEEVSRKLWDSVCYYNFVQRLIPIRDKRPTYGDLILGWEVNFNLYNILLPDIMLFCGVESAKHFQTMNDRLHAFNANAIELTKDMINGAYPKGFIIERNGKTTLCLFIKHPSQGYTWEPWSDMLDEISMGKMVEFRKHLLA